MRKNVKRTIAVLSAVCMLPCPQVANVAVMAQNVSGWKIIFRICFL